MPVVDGAFVMKNAVVTVESVSYPNQCAKARLVPDTPMQQYRTLVPDGTVTDVDSPAWTFEITFLQVNKSGGLAHALRAAMPGDQLDVTLAPRNLTGDDQATFVIIAMPPPFGGDQGKFSDAEMTFGVLGQPVFGTVS